MMTNYLFISNSSNFKIDKFIIEKINSTLNEKNIQFVNKEIEKNHFYEWVLNKKFIDNIIKERINNFCKNLPIDINFLKISPPRKKKLLICDMDSTIIKEESLDEIAKEARIGNEIKIITEKAMKGELDFKDALLKRIKFLKSFPLKKIISLNSKIHINEGAEELIKEMKKESCLTVLISGGFAPSVSYVAKKIKFDHYHCNNFLYKKFEEKIVLNGGIQTPILDKYSKLSITKEYLKKLNLTLNDVISVGDGANDVDLITNAGIGVSYKGKNILNKVADVVFNHTSLKGLLYLQGYKKIC